jgi:hypothetical protein
MVVRSQTMSRVGKCERGEDQQHQGRYNCIVCREGVTSADRAGDLSCLTQCEMISRLVRARK